MMIGLIKSELDSIKKQENVRHIDHSMFLMSHQDCHRSAFVPQRHFSWEKGHHISLVVMGHLIVQQDVKKNEMSFCSFLCCCLPFSPIFIVVKKPDDGTFRVFSKKVNPFRA